MLESHISSGSDPFTGSKNFLTASYVSSFRVGGSQLGLAPFSNSTQRTPSCMLASVEMCSTIWQSSRKQSLRVDSLARVMERQISSREAGHCSAINLATWLWKGSCLAQAHSQMAFAEGRLNSQLICSSLSSPFLVGGLLYLSSTLQTTPFMLPLSTPTTACSKSVFAFSRSALWMQKWARPAATTSSPLSLEPVMPRQYPILFLSRESTQLTPTSVKKPSLASGMAKRVFSVATMKGAQAVRPTPPPMVTPSQQATCTAPIRDTLQSSVNSSLKKVHRCDGVDPGMQMALTSPPAQKALPSPSNQATLCCSM